MLYRLCLIVIACVASAAAQDVTGRWVGAADSTDEGGIKRSERQNIEIKNEDGKFTAMSIGRNGRPGNPLVIHVDGGKVNLYRYLELDGGEHLRWKAELKDGKLVGSFSAQHNDPKKWIYDRIGVLTMSKAEAPPAGETPK